MDNQPWSQEAEEALIGSILKDAYNLPDIIDLITSESFYSLQNQLIFRCFETLSEANKNIDIVTLMDELGDKIDTVGGMGYLAETAHNTPSNRNDIAYAKIVKDKKKERDILSMASEMVSIIHADELSSEENVNNALSVVTNFDHEETSVIELTNDELLKKMIDDVEYRSKLDGSLIGLDTGFDDINARTSGFMDSDLIVIAGRPSMGKTCMGLNIIQKSLELPSGASLVFSMEMSASQLMMRMASNEGNIPGDRLRNGCFEDEDWPKFDKAVRVMKGNNLIIDDRPALTPQQVRAKALKVKRQHGRINVIMVDYMQLMTINGRSEGRTNEITKISGSLKALAKELDCPVIALAQLNRDLEKRPNKRPMMSDLRESGAIEQDADIIMFLYRDEVYNENSEYKGICECIFGKFRQGETGTEFLKSELHYSRFLNLLNWTKPEDKPLESSGFTYKK